MKRILLPVTLLFVAGLAIAQPNTTPVTAPAPTTPSTSSHHNWRAHKAELKALREQEKAAIATVKADTGKSKDEKKTSIKQIRMDFRQKRHALLKQ